MRRPVSSAGLLRRITPAQWTTALSVSLAACGALLTGTSGHEPVLASGVPVGIIFATLTVTFFLGELFLMSVEFRRQAHSFTLAGVPLILGVLILPPALCVLARLVGSLLAFGHQRIAADKALYNCAAYTFEAAADVTLVHLLLTGSSPGDLDARAVLTTIAVLGLLDQLVSCLVLLVIRMHAGPMNRHEIVEILVAASVLCLIANVFGIAVVLLIRHGPIGVIVVVVLTGVAFLGYRAQALTRQRHQALTLVHDFVAGGVGAESLQALAEVLLPNICTLLRGSTVELMLLDPATSTFSANSSTQSSILVLSTGENARVTSRHRDLDPHDWTLVRALSGEEPLLAARTTKDRGVRGWLTERGLRDAIVVPLPASSGLSGTLTVSDRLGETATFTQDDLVLLQTLAGHLAVAVRSARLVEKLGFDATHDSLTGLVNRAHLAEKINEVLSHPAPSAAVLLLDLDGFKEVNDVLGHDVGDRLLIVIGERVTACVSAEATVARLGGDEFAVLLPRIVGPASRVIDVAERVADAIAQPVAFDEAMLTPEASIGIAMTTPADTNVELLRQADTAMYEAKSHDRRVAIYTPAMDRGRIERLELLADLRLALAAHPEQFVLHYQPKIDLASRTLTGAEALVRWNHPTRGELPPDLFIPLAESTGLIEQLSPLVLQMALAECAQWPAEISVAVNLSARNISDPTLPQRVSDGLAAAGVNAEQLVLEITESSVMGDPDQTVPVLHQLHGLGLCLSLDDFGTGYSSLSYLQRLPVGEVKIDRSFVLGLSEDDQDGSRALIRSIAALGASLGLRIVAEGIEDEKTLCALLELGCDTGQGYYISRPLPPMAFRAKLESARCSGQPRDVVVGPADSPETASTRPRSAAPRRGGPYALASTRHEHSTPR